MDVTCFLLGLAGWFLMAVTLVHDNWKESSSTFSTIYENLWSTCVESNDVTNCLRFNTLLGLPAHIHVCRALMIVALLLGGVASIGMALGLSGRMLEHKVKVVVSGGALFIISGVSTLIAVSYYASTVVEQFYDPLYPGAEFDIGTGVYLGWAASALAILGGSMMWVSMLCCRSRSDPPRATAMYAAPTTRHGMLMATTYV